MQKRIHIWKIYYTEEHLSTLVVISGVRLVWNLQLHTCYTVHTAN